MSRNGIVNKGSGEHFVSPELGVSIQFEDLNKLNYPVLVQRKFDGYRCIVINGKAYTREGNLIPNHRAQKLLKKSLPLRPNTYYDGELMVIDENGTEKFEHCGIFRDFMASMPKENLQAVYVMFAIVDNNKKVIPGRNRSSELLQSVIEPKNIKNYSPDELKIYYAHTRVCKEPSEIVSLLDSNPSWEGVMIRRPEDRYWFGKRAGKTNPFLLKLKQKMKEGWGTVVDIAIQKSQTKQRMVGSLKVAMDDGTECVVGTGLNYNQRIGLLNEWSNYRIRVGWDKLTRFGNKKFPRVLELRRMA